MVANAWRIIQRVGRLLRVHALLDVMLLTRSGTEFWVWALTDTAMNAAAVAGMVLLVTRFHGIGGWSHAQILFLLGFGALSKGMVNLLFGYNVSAISRRIGRGQLDHTLIQPQPLWMAFLTEGFNPAFGLPTLVPGGGLIIWALKELHLHTGLLWWALFAGSMFCSIAIVLAFQWLWGSAAFYAPRAAEEINSATSELTEDLKIFPLSGKSPAIRDLLLTVVPAGFIAWVPAAALTHAPGALPLICLPGAAVSLCALTAIVFTRGLNYYRLTGSQRYSDFGHRR
jgi:ABC-2 type transport system permease protein